MKIEIGGHKELKVISHTPPPVTCLKSTYVENEVHLCVLPKGHDGRHQSSNNYEWNHD